MQKPNYQRMYDLIDAVFATRQDPEQLQVDAEQMKKLQALHPATLTEEASEEGPLIWVLLIPTNRALMQSFLEDALNEKQLLEQTPLNTPLDCLYLCSVTALPEVRGKGRSRALCLQAIEAIRSDHPIQHLFVWPFTKEGAALAENVAKVLGLPLYQRAH
jgi:hypothetical protein